VGNCYTGCTALLRLRQRTDCPEYQKWYWQQLGPSTGVSTITVSSHSKQYCSSRTGNTLCRKKILMTLVIKRVHNLPPHLSCVSTLPDITQKRKTYVVFLSVV